MLINTFLLIYICYNNNYINKILVLYIYIYSLELINYEYLFCNQYIYYILLILNLIFNLKF